MKNFYLPLALAIATAPMFHVAMAAADYAKGVVIINENKYGEASTINHLQPDLRTGYFTYRVFQKENPKRTLGQTSCSSAYDNLLYVVSKQSKAQNATTAGGILTAIEPTTMKWQWQMDQLDPSGKRAEGRGFLGVTTDKAYVSSSNGIWVIDLATHTSKGMIEGTQNPNGVDDKPASDGTSTIYHGQCGTMVAAAGRVFAAHQIFGLLVIDPTTDTLEHTISLDFVADGAAIGSIVADKEGFLWLSVAKKFRHFRSFTIRTGARKSIYPRDFGIQPARRCLWSGHDMGFLEARQLLRLVHRTLSFLDRSRAEFLRRFRNIQVRHHHR